MSVDVTNWHSRLPGQARRFDGSLAIGYELSEDRRVLRLTVRDPRGKRLTVDLRGDDLDGFLADVARVEVRLERKATGRRRR